MKRNKQNSGLGRIDYRRWTGLLFFSFLSIISSHAQHSEQPQTIKTIKNFQSFHANNLSIKHLQENNALKPETVPKNVLQFSPNQTYVVQEKVQTIRPIDRSAYRNLDTDLRNQYASSDIKLLPETFIQTGSSTNDQLVYRIGFESKLPLQYVFDSKKFEGTMKFFLFPESTPSSYTLKIPVLIEVVSNDIRTIDPVSEEIDHLSIPLTEIRFEGSDLSDSAQIKIITKSNPEGYETFLRVRPAIELDSKRRTIQGFGVQTIPVSVRVVGSSLIDSVKVTFNPGKGTVEPGASYVRYDRPSVVNLRSEGIGSITLNTSSIFGSNELNFDYVFPWMFILMAVLGGIIGGLLKYFSKMEKMSLLNAVLKGTLLGFIGSVAYYVLGIRLIDLNASDVFNEFAVLGFSALTAYLGIRVRENPGKA